MVNFKEIVDSKLIPLIQEMIRNRCVNTGSSDSGNETRSALTLQTFFSGYGIQSEILISRPERGNLLIRIPGTDPKAPSLMYMGHMDVVNADPEQWSIDPFAGEIHKGYLWGRGTIDMLNITASAAVAFAELIKQKGPLKGDLVFLAVADEEASGRLGARWLVENHWDKVKADYLITEQGGFFVDTDSGPGIAITVGEKGIAWVRLKAKGTAGHGSMPYKADNALLKLSEAAIKIGSLKTLKHFTPAYCKMADRLGRGRLQKYLLTHSWGVDRAIKKIFKSSPGAAKLLYSGSRITISPNLLESGEKVNIIADKGFLELDIRLLPDDSVEDIQKIIKKALGPLIKDISIEFFEFFPSITSQKTTPLMEAVRRIAGSMYPDADFIPVYMTGVTDGRFWRQRGTVVYGLTLFDSEMTLDKFVSMVHGNDEKVSINSLERSLQFFYNLPLEFFSIPSICKN